MNKWDTRTTEEKGILNPSFFSLVIWSASKAYKKNSGSNLPFELAFIIIPIILHKEIRSSLPRSTATSFLVWLNENRLTRVHISNRAPLLSKYVKEAIVFGGIYELFKIDKFCIVATDDFEKKINKNIKNASDEVQECIKKADFVGKWLSGAGDTATILALLGVRP